MIGAVLGWVGMMWIVGVMLHFGYKNNPHQPRIFVGRLLTALMTFGTVEGTVALAPTLFQLNNLLFLIGAITEYNLNGFGPPNWTIRIWFIAQVLCGILGRVFNQLKGEN